MSIVNIVLNHRHFQLSCEDGYEEQLLKLVSEVNTQLETIKATNKAASFELLLIILVLSMQDKLQNVQNNNRDNAAAIQVNKYSADSEEFAETLNTIARYLENLAQKISR